MKSGVIKEITIPELEVLEDIPLLWTEREEAILRKYYPTKPTRAIAKAVGRTITAVQQKAQSMDLVKGRG